MEFKEITDDQLEPLLQESEYAFLPASDTPDTTTSSLIKKFKTDTYYGVFGFLADNEAVSYIVALSGREDSEIAIGPMYVTKSAQGKGLGKRQVAAFIEIFKERGYESFYTKTWLGNVTSRHIFESLGFIELGRKANDRVNGDASILYIFRSKNRK